MPPEIVDASAFSPDIQDFPQVLHTHEVRLMIAGGEAVIFYGHIRVTGDIDIYYDRKDDNALRLYKALEEFWQGEIPELEARSSSKNAVSSSSMEFLQTGSTSSTISMESTSIPPGGDEPRSCWRGSLAALLSVTSALKTSSRAIGLPGGQRIKKISRS